MPAISKSKVVDARRLGRRSRWVTWCIRTKQVEAAPRLLNSGTFSCVGNVAADEIALELVGGVHHHERARCRIDDEITRVSEGTDQACDQAAWLGVRVKFAGYMLRSIFSGQRLRMP